MKLRMRDEAGAETGRTVVPELLQLVQLGVRRRRNVGEDKTDKAQDRPKSRNDESDSERCKYHAKS